MNLSSVRLLTYNVSWESMTGKSGWKLCNNKSDPDSEKYFMKCIENVAKIIDLNGPYDFVCLQEASNYDKIISESKCLGQMDWRIHQSGPEVMVTFWDRSKYRLDESNILASEFNPGRPFQALTFNRTISVINIHVGHHAKHILIKKLNNLMENLATHTSGPTHRFIMAGDFNNEMDPVTKINNILFYGTDKEILTCCGPTNYKYHFDHVLDSVGPPQKILLPKVNKLSSDHLPVLAILEPNHVTDFFYKYTKYKTLYLGLKHNS